MTWGFVNGIAKGIQFVSRGASLINEIDDLLESQQFNNLKSTSIASRTTLLFLGIAEIAFALAGEGRSTSALHTKSFETIIHILNLPIQSIEAIIVLDDPNATTRDKIKAVEKKIIGSLLSLTRSISESELGWQQHYRDLPPEKQAELEFPIYKSNGEDLEIVGYKPFNKEECLQTISNLQSCIPKMNVAEAAAEVGLAGRVLDITDSAFRFLVAQVVALSLPPGPGPGGAGALRPVRPVAAVHLPQAAPLNMNFGNGDDSDFDRAVSNSLATTDSSSAVNPSQQNTRTAQSINEDSEEFTNLKRFKYIPVELHEDGVFKQFVCSITQKPIRFIVEDPTTTEGAHQYYERSEIERWLRIHTTSPLTRKTLTVSMLKPCVSVQMIINSRLDEYSQRVRQEVQRLGILPFDQDRVREAMDNNH